MDTTILDNIYNGPNKAGLLGDAKLLMENREYMSVEKFQDTAREIASDYGIDEAAIYDYLAEISESH